MLSKRRGAAGKDNFGLIRLHQFGKVEIVVIVNNLKKEEEIFLKMKNTIEENIKLLNLEYRIIELPSNDLGFSSSKTYDFEVWSNYFQKYIEISSLSNCGNFQSMRAEQKNKNKQYPITMNGSSLPIERIIMLLIEYNLINCE